MDRVIIFDFDGVLANSIDPMLEYAQQVCEELGYPCVPTQNDLEALEKMEFSEYGLQLGIPQEQIDEFVSRNFEMFNTRKEPLALIPEMDNIVVQLANSAILAVVTGNSRIVVNNFLRAHGLFGEFQKILCAEDEGNRVEKIYSLLALYDNPSREFYFVGDAVSDVRAAGETGIKSVAVGWGHQSLSKLRKAGPDFVVDRPVDLISLFNEIKT